MKNEPLTWKQDMAKAAQQWRDFRAERHVRDSSPEDERQPRGLDGRFNSSTASNSANGGHAATATANTLRSGAEATFAQSDNATPNKNANHARRRR